MGLATFLNRMTSGCIALIFLPLSNAVTPQVCFLLFALMAVWAMYFTWTRVPETKGKSLEEIENTISDGPVAPPLRQLLCGDCGSLGSYQRMGGEEHRVEEYELQPQRVEAGSEHSDSDA